MKKLKVCKYCGCLENDEKGHRPLDLETEKSKWVQMHRGHPAFVHFFKEE